MEEENIKLKIADIENRISTDMDFWSDSLKAQAEMKELRDLKYKLEGEKALDRGGCTMSILAGAGGDDSEDWVRMLLNMYEKYIIEEGYTYNIIHAHRNDLNGYRNINIEIRGKGVEESVMIYEMSGPYGKLKNENGVHRLVRLSPFNANDKRHTSFALVEVLPILPDIHKVEIPSEDLEINFANAGGPGGQNVNKRETKVIMKHIPTGITVTVATERNQEQNRSIALEMIQAKLYKKRKDDRQAEIEGRQISKNTEIEWGSQIRNYVLHPYKLLKDTRSGYESTDIENILEKGLLKPVVSSLMSV